MGTVFDALSTQFSWVGFVCHTGTLSGNRIGIKQLGVCLGGKHKLASADVSVWGKINAWTSCSRVIFSRFLQMI